MSETPRSEAGSPPGRAGLVLGAIALCAFAGALSFRGSSRSSPSPTGEALGTLEYLWTYRPRDGVDPPGPGTVFCIVADAVDPLSRKLVVGTESLGTPEAIRHLLSGRGQQLRETILLEDTAPSRGINFQRFDLDHDGFDEVLLTGAGGAGGTSFLQIYRVRDSKVERLFSDTSRFGFILFDRDRTGQYEVANPGFEWVSGADHVIREDHFTIYRLEASGYVGREKLTPEEMQGTLKKLSEFAGTPLSAGTNGTLRTYR